MKRLKFVKPEQLSTAYRWEEDVFRIVDVCYKKGYEITTYDAQAAWEEYSDDFAACWLTLSNKDDDVFDIVMQYCQIEEQDYGSSQETSS